MSLKSLVAIYYATIPKGQHSMLARVYKSKHVRTNADPEFNFYQTACVGLTVGTYTYHNMYSRRVHLQYQHLPDL